METLPSLSLKLRSLTLFRSLLKEPVLCSFCQLLGKLEQPESFSQADAYCAFVSQLYAAGGNWSQHLLDTALEDENPYVRLKVQGKPIPPYMEDSLERELTLLQHAAQVTSEEILSKMACGLSLPVWETSPVCFLQVYRERMEQLSSHGFGIFARCHVFTLDEQGRLIPVTHPDPQTLVSLTGYEPQRQKLLVNTQALVDGLPANNILLYGDAGTGKSSVVKALANEFAPQGLRLIEVKKTQLRHIPALMENLSDNPLKFLLFIDDLSFSPNDAGFTSLKAILEGSVCARPKNMVVYATSNRRHLVRETFSDRMGDDLHLSDTLEEVSSLSARFGLTITFSKPDKELYCFIIQELANEYGLKTPLPQLLVQAEAHAIRSGGRSPRTARQFVEFMKATENAQEKSSC